MEDWKEKIKSMRLKEGDEEPEPWSECAKVVQAEFPELNMEKAKQKARDVVRRDKRYKAEKDYSKDKYSVEMKSDGSIVSEKFITLRDGEELTPDFLLEAHGLKVGLWEVVSYKNNMWNGQNKEGRQIMYQSKLTAKPCNPRVDISHIDRFYKTLDSKVPKAARIKPKGNVMAEINIADLHLGKLCWSGETPENFDHKIARDVYYQIIYDIVEKLKSEPLEYITFVWANDFFNSDNEEQTTTGGTRQDTDARAKKLFDVGTDMLNKGMLIIRNELNVPIKTFYTRSNHDESTGYHALKVVEAFFKDDQNVEVDTSAYPRKYILYGNSLNGYCHGDKEKGKPHAAKASRLASLMPIEVPELWAKAKFREFHTAHLHSEYMWEEVNGVIVRRISSPTAQDKWHTDSGYVGAVRKAQTFLYDKEYGNIGTINTPVKEAK